MMGPSSIRTTVPLDDGTVVRTDDGTVVRTDDGTVVQPYSVWKTVLSLAVQGKGVASRLTVPR